MLCSFDRVLLLGPVAFWLVPLALHIAKHRNQATSSKKHLIRYHHSCHLSRSYFIKAHCRHSICAPRRRLTLSAFLTSGKLLQLTMSTGPAVSHPPERSSGLDLIYTHQFSLLDIRHLPTLLTDRLDITHRTVGQIIGPVAKGGFEKLIRWGNYEEDRTVMRVLDGPRLVLRCSRGGFASGGVVVIQFQCSVAREMDR